MIQLILSIMNRNLLLNKKIKNFSQKHEKKFDFFIEIIFQ